MTLLEKVRALSAPEAGVSQWARARNRLMVPVDAGALMVLRIGFGSLMAWEAWRYIRHFVDGYFLEPKFLFTWWLFDWVRPFNPGTYFIVALMGVAGLGVALGLFYRQAGTILWVGIAYIFLLEKVRYLNHVYLATILAFLLTIVPAHVGWSLDARRKPWVASRTVPTWTVWLMRFQIGVPYFYAGIAKMNFDWLVRSEPLREWLLRKTDFPLIGHFFTNELATRTMAWSSMLLDLSVPLLMLNKRTRAPAYGFAIGFHFLNSRLFGIGVFPWMMMIATTMFFDYDWPKQMWATVRRGSRTARRAIALGAVAGGTLALTLPTAKLSPVQGTVGAIAVAVFVFHMLPARLRLPADVLEETVAAPSPWQRFSFRRVTAVFLICWVVIQLTVPLRHFFIPGNVHWTDEGHRFAWHMLLRQKVGWAIMHVTDPATGSTWVEDLGRHISPTQASAMATKPDLLVQFAHYLEAYYRGLGLRDVEVRAETSAWLNSRAPEEYIDPTLDLTTVSRPVMPPSRWVRPLAPFE